MWTLVVSMLQSASDSYSKRVRKIQFFSVTLSNKQNKARYTPLLDTSSYYTHTEMIYHYSDFFRDLLKAAV